MLQIIDRTHNKIHVWKKGDPVPGIVPRTLAVGMPLEIHLGGEELAMLLEAMDATTRPDPLGEALNSGGGVYRP